MHSQAQKVMHVEKVSQMINFTAISQYAFPGSLQPSLLKRVVNEKRKVRETEESFTPTPDTQNREFGVSSVMWRKGRSEGVRGIGQPKAHSCLACSHHWGHDF